MGNDQYRRFVEEAFVKPIRSVLIVDDQYPTYDEVLRHRESLDTEEEYDSKKSWRGDPKRIRRVIRRFRENDPPLLVDIHDGENVDAESETAVARHLHQSDLLILDYNLEGVQDGGGSRAIDILRHLSDNDHFNLVVIYTKEDIDAVFDNVRWGLLAPKPSELSEQQHEDIEGLIESAEIESDGLHARLRESIGSEQYFHSRCHPATYKRTMGLGLPPYTSFRAECEKAGISPPNRRLILPYFLELRQKDNFGQMNKGVPDDSLTWCAEAPVMWIKGKSLFVCFSSKSDDDDLLNELRLALYNWNPHPSRLFLTKLRAVMDDRGVVAQAHALTPKHAMAYWYHQLMDAGPSERRWHVGESVVRHSDTLMGAILPDVECFARRLIESEAETGESNQRCLDHFDVDFSNEEDNKRATLEHNAFVCSKEPIGWHLTTGHVFSMEDKLWLCLSPACDMVPSQLAMWRKKLVGDRLPFIAIQLHCVSSSLQAKDIHSNRYVFLRHNSEVKIYRFDDGSSNNPSPWWEVFYAENAGRFLDGKLELLVWRTHKNDAKEGPENNSPKLVYKRHCAAVVSQLRYEYALNLIQKLGVSLTRVGLGFSGGMN